MPENQCCGEVLVEASAEGEALVLEQAISFWGGINPDNGQIIDIHHPQCGQAIGGKILVLPGTRGSTAGPGALLETIAAGNGPLAIILTGADAAALIAIIVAQWSGESTIPIVKIIDCDDFTITSGDQLRIVGGTVTRR